MGGMRGMGGVSGVRMLLRPERLGMKIGSSDRVETIFSKGQEGLRFTQAPRPP